MLHTPSTRRMGCKHHFLKTIIQYVDLSVGNGEKTTPAHCKHNSPHSGWPWTASRRTVHCLEQVHPNPDGLRKGNWEAIGQQKLCTEWQIDLSSVSGDVKDVHLSPSHYKCVLTTGERGCGGECSVYSRMERSKVKSPSHSRHSFLFPAVSPISTLWTFACCTENMKKKFRGRGCAFVLLKKWRDVYRTVCLRAQHALLFVFS